MAKNKLQHSDSMWKGASPEIFSNAEDMRNNLTEAEKLLWEQLESNKFHNLKFRRQHPILNYVVDFYCHKLKLVIEIDGGYHENKEQIEKDRERTENLIFNELTVIRYTNSQVKEDITAVLTGIEEFIGEYKKKKK
ncbi:MAG TPA: endonuclease domain-containing protein [Lutibacter sp.]